MACILPPPPDRSRGADVDGLEAYTALVCWVAENEWIDEAEAPRSGGMPTEPMERLPSLSLEEMPTIPMPTPCP